VGVPPDAAQLPAQRPRHRQPVYAAELHIAPPDLLDAVAGSGPWILRAWEPESPRRGQCGATAADLCEMDWRCSGSEKRSSQRWPITAPFLPELKTRGPQVEQ